MKSVFTYEPDDYFDCGDLGAHPIKFIAWITEVEPERYSTSIMSAMLHLKIGAHVIELSILPVILDSRLEWEEEIFAAWDAIRNSDWEEGA